MNDKRNLIALQTWEGVVIEISENEDTFFARLTDITNGGTDEVVELSFDDVSSDDKELVEKAARSLSLA